MARPPADPIKRFESKVTRTDSCHEWTGTIHRDGYGKFYFRGEQMAAHRAAFILYVGEIPSVLHVLHKCDNRKCVCPEHLYAGTPRQNVADKVARCDWWGNMKFPMDTVRACEAFSVLGFSQQEISSRTGVSQSMVSKYLRGKYLRTRRERK